MLDLKELERQLKDALSHETEESLTNWLMTQRKKEDEASYIISFAGKEWNTAFISYPKTSLIKHCDDLHLEYWIPDDYPKEPKSKKNMTSNFSGSFFCCK